MLAVVGSVGVFVAIISSVALLGPWRRALLGPVGVVSAATMVVLAADVMTGSRLQLSSLMGLQPVVGGRFYGMGNVTFALFATATILLCIAVADHFVRAGRRQVAVACGGRDRPGRGRRRRVAGLGQRLRRPAGVRARPGLLRAGRRGRAADLAPGPARSAAARCSSCW